MSGGEPMDHAAAHERIEDLLLEPARLGALKGSPAPEDLALREHLAGCPTCAADLEAWRRLQLLADEALPADPNAAAAAVEPIALPPSLRAGVLAAVRSSGDAAALGEPSEIGKGRPERGERMERIERMERMQRRRSRAAAWLALAASLVVVVSAGYVTVDQLGQRAAAEAEARELEAALAVVDRMLATEHKVVELRTTSGASAGTISWSRHDWVVLTGALAHPDSGKVYRCWLETDGRSVPIGEMEFAGPIAYWVASLDEWQTWEIGATTRFVVSLESIGAPRRTGPAILDALLSS